jgi:hypothetical protein
LCRKKNLLSGLNESNLQHLPRKADALHDRFILSTAGLFPFGCPRIKLHFQVKPVHLRLGPDNLKGLPHRDIPLPAGHPRNPAAIRFKFDPVI